MNCSFTELPAALVRQMAESGIKQIRQKRQERLAAEIKRKQNQNWFWQKPKTPEQILKGLEKNQDEWPFKYSFVGANNAMYRGQEYLCRELFLMADMAIRMGNGKVMVTSADLFDMSC